jgi:hypothetical protein
MKSSSLVRIVGALVCAFFLSSPLRAGLMGVTVSSAGYDPTPATAVVGAGAEFTGIVGYMNFDFADNSLTLTTSVPVSWSGFGTFTFTFDDVLISSFALQANSNTGGNHLTFYGFTANTVWLDLNSGSMNDGIAVYSINSTSVPDSGATMALFGLGLAALGLARRRFAAR